MQVLWYKPLLPPVGLASRNSIMVSTFEHRFFRSISSFQFYLKIFGFFLDNSTESTRLSLARIQKLFQFSLVLLCFFTSFAAGLYQFLFQSLPLFSFVLAGYNQHLNYAGKTTRIDAFSKFLETTSLFITSSLTYLAFVFTARRTIRLFCANLEPTDNATKRPDLTFLRNYSIVALVWTLTTVTSINKGWILYQIITTPIIF